ncbi:MAG: Nramp family divalent metal transporter [Methanocorpusculum sp.]|nr:Nramp family divalent metal transporter [Methanocorpusculum sp.]
MKGSLFSLFKQWFKRNFVFFGPGLLLAITAAGEAGVTEAIEIGAHYGLLLIWAVIITLIFKYAFTIGIARYTLSTGQTFFDGLNNLPGPKNWGSYLIIISYFVEIFAIGAMLMLAATFLDYIIPGVYSIILIAVFLACLAFTILRTRGYHYFEYIMAGVVVILAVFVVYCLADYPLSLEMVIEGIIPNIPHGSETAILAIIGVVGSGLNLMLYSVWLNEKTRRHDDKSKDVCSLRNESFFKKYIRSVSVDVLIGFIFVAVITIGFMFLGYAGFTVSFMPHGSALNIDIIITQVIYIFSTVPYGVYLFLAFVSIIFFGAVVIGLDARSKALSTVIGHLILEQKPSEHKIFDKITRKLNHDKLYQIVLLLLMAVMAVSFTFGDPMLTIRSISSVCAILFGVFGFILIYLNHKLPQYARGGRMWMLIIGIGSVLSVYVALLIESSFLTFGIPLIEHMLVIMVVIFVFTKSQMFKKLIAGKANTFDKLWAVALFGLLSVYGVFRGVSMGGGSGVLFNFADIGPAIAGLVGGPVVGALAGLIGCFYRFTLGGDTVIACSIAMIISGIFAGVSIYNWKGKITYIRVFILALLTQGFNLVVLMSAAGLAGGMTPTELSGLITTTFLPMFVVNIIGLFMFVFMTNKFGDFVPNKIDIIGSITEVLNRFRRRK